MKYWLDSEFYEQQGSLELISIGLVSEDDCTLYIENADFDWGKVPADAWIQTNVRPHLSGNGIPYAHIGPTIQKWIGDEKPEFWGWFADYDWVLFCWLFGSMIELPRGWPQFCLDLQQLNREVRAPRPPHLGTAHNALDDALWTKQFWELVMEVKENA